ncbi:DUF1775 domain-containing protein [Streptomyces sp. NPDC050422]|uniref:DUF1775 domain-containing protein n=1 Tax=Streptomyces sp. NPDC050422 TaxID=3365614 RepID=UPI0037B0C313
MLRRTRRHISPLATVAAGAAGAVLLAAGTAAAHVRVIGDVIPGRPATLQFRVPSEMADATTVRIAVAVPPDLTVTSVPVLDGWTEKTVAGPAGQGAHVVWTAESGHAIKPAASRTFTVKVGPVPDRYSLSFDTEQTYSNGTSVAWNEEQTGSEEVEFPTPVLVINPSASSSPAVAGDSPRPTGPTAPEPSVAAKPAASAETQETKSSLSLWATIGAGLVVAAILGAGFQRRRNNAASHS